MMIDICLASMIAMNCLGGAGPSTDCNIPVEKAKEILTEVQRSHSLVLLEGESGTNPKGQEVFRSLWVPPGMPELAMVVHYVPMAPKDSQCSRMSVPEFIEHSRQEEQFNNQNKGRLAI